MAQIISISLKKSKIENIETFKGKAGEEYYNLDVILHDEKDKYGQDCAVTEKQSKDDRLAKKPKNYVGSGLTVWKSKDNSPKTEGGFNAPEAKSGLPF